MKTNNNKLKTFRIMVLGQNAVGKSGKDYKYEKNKIVCKITKKKNHFFSHSKSSHGTIHNKKIYW
jgi:hypothetical protein